MRERMRRRLNPKKEEKRERTQGVPVATATRSFARPRSRRSGPAGCQTTRAAWKGGAAARGGARCRPLFMPARGGERVLQPRLPFGREAMRFSFRTNLFTNSYELVVKPSAQLARHRVQNCLRLDCLYLGAALKQTVKAVETALPALLPV
ncbi:hypothetical protein NDU88_001435 [Pleurodeles waltl]|uniref:Uncharacterized protein n=1 Tax=Pleurodeles waltl TaxID=8319 RepID=A0AAV7SAU2_PLEWA|nr:hypothetical protein NDU88_001435 [Pleurodeles waltl]